MRAQDVCDGKRTDVFVAELFGRSGCANVIGPDQNDVANAVLGGIASVGVDLNGHTFSGCGQGGACGLVGFGESIGKSGSVRDGDTGRKGRKANYVRIYRRIKKG